MSNLEILYRSAGAGFSWIGDNVEPTQKNVVTFFFSEKLIEQHKGWNCKSQKLEMANTLDSV